MPSSREFPERPIVGVGGVVIADGRALLIRRGSEPLRGEWSIPGGTLELGETLVEGCARELRAGSDVIDVAFAREDELGKYHLTETATRVIQKAFAMARARLR